MFTMTIWYKMCTVYRRSDFSKAQTQDCMEKMCRTEWNFGPAEAIDKTSIGFSRSKTLLLIFVYIYYVSMWTLDITGNLHIHV